MWVVDTSAWIEAPRGSPAGVKVRAELSGVAETIDRAHMLTWLNKTELTAGDADETPGVLLKYQDDIAKVRGAEAARLLNEARAGP